jgi:hypothetical protein
MYQSVPVLWPRGLRRTASGSQPSQSCPAPLLGRLCLVHSSGLITCPAACLQQVSSCLLPPPPPPSLRITDGSPHPPCSPSADCALSSGKCWLMNLTSSSLQGDTKPGRGPGSRPIASAAASPAFNTPARLNIHHNQEDDKTVAAYTVAVSSLYSLFG